jgi:hypothetical protein
VTTCATELTKRARSTLPRKALDTEIAVVREGAFLAPNFVQWLFSNIPFKITIRHRQAAFDATVAGNANHTQSRLTASPKVVVRPIDTPKQRLVVPVIAETIRSQAPDFPRGLNPSHESVKSWKLLGL